MNVYYTIVILGGLFILLPLLFSPVGWTVAVVLLALWLAVTVLGKVGWDMKMNRERGMRSEPKLTDKIAGNDNDGWRRR